MRKGSLGRPRYWVGLHGSTNTFIRPLLMNSLVVPWPMSIPVNQYIIPKSLSLPINDLIVPRFWLLTANHLFIPMHQRITALFSGLCNYLFILRPLLLPVNDIFILCLTPVNHLFLPRPLPLGLDLRPFEDFPKSKLNFAHLPEIRQRADIVRARYVNKVNLFKRAEASCARNLYVLGRS